MVIRPPGSADVDAIVDMGERMHRESVYAFLPYNREKVQRLFRAFVDHPETWGGFVAEDDGKIVGMIGGYLTDYFFCDEKLASDMILFLDQPYRGGLTSGRLIRAFEQWAIERGARELCLGISTGINIDSIGRFYEHMGMTRVGAVYKRRLDGEAGTNEARRFT